MRAILNENSVEISDQISALSLYSVGVYSSFIVRRGMVKGWDYHVERVQKDSRIFLSLNVDRKMLVQSVRRFIDELADDEEITVRTTVFAGRFSLSAPHLADDPQILVTGRTGSSIAGNAVSLQSVECHRPFAEHKVTNIAAAMTYRRIAKAAGFDDAVFVNSGHITEGPTWNIFFISGDRIITPHSEANLLPGVTRRLLIEGLGDTVAEEQIGESILHRADAAFVTNAAIGAKPVASINGRDLDPEHHMISKAKDYYDAIDWMPIT